MVEERRRAPRYEIPTGELAILPVSLSVKLIDISPAGALLQCGQPVRIGSRGQLRMSFGGRPLSLDLEIRRATLGEAGVGYRIGVMFLDVTAEAGAIIASFTRNAGHLQ